MTLTINAIRILSSAGSIWAYLAFRANLRKEQERRITIQRLEDVIRGGQ